MSGSWGYLCWPGPLWLRPRGTTRRAALPGNHRQVEAGPPDPPHQALAPQARSRRLFRYPATQNGFLRRPKAPSKDQHIWQPAGVSVGPEAARQPSLGLSGNEGLGLRTRTAPSLG